MKILSGVYKIQSKIKPKRIYIGSAKNITIRWGIHISDLKLNKHHSIKLQRHYNKYGIEDLEFSIILFCSIENLILNEQLQLNKYIPYFNCSKIAGSNLGNKWSEESKQKMKGNKNSIGAIRTDEQKQYLREIHLGNKNHMYGKEISEETRKKCSDAANKRWNKNNKNQ